MKPSDALVMYRSAVLRIVSEHRTKNARIFGSVLHGTDNERSDLDMLVDAMPGATLFDLGDLQDELQTLLGVQVDVLTPDDLPIKIRQDVLSEARPI